MGYVLWRKLKLRRDEKGRGWGVGGWREVVLCCK